MLKTLKIGAAGVHLDIDYRMKMVIFLSTKGTPQVLRKVVNSMTRILDLIPRFELSTWPGWSTFEPFFSTLSRPYVYVEEECEWMPSADIAENGKEYLVSLEVPGIDIKKLDVSYSSGVLTIKGEKMKETVEEERCYCSERYSGSFERSFRIPGKVKQEEIGSSYKDGILKVTLPKHEESQVKKIEVKH
jgi:HSP20 family protein